MEVGAALQQLEELECMLSMFPDANELQVDVEAKSSLEEFVATDGMPRPDSRIVYTLFYKVQIQLFCRDICTDKYYYINTVYC